MKELLTKIVASHLLHAKWLNTLSYLENCGAKKIAACEHPTLVKEEMLKHAAEEFRHAHHFKRQIKKVSTMNLETYSRVLILGGMATLHYLNALDLKTSKYLKVKKVPKEAAYLLVTYAIELRARSLYTIYDEILRKAKSKVTVKSILLEEEDHLNEMIEGIKLLPKGYEHADQVKTIEMNLYNIWVDSIRKEVL